MELALRCAPEPISADESKQAKFAMSYLANHSSDVHTTFAMQILSFLLFNGPSAPLYKARPARILFLCASVCAAPTLNATGQSRVTLSLR